MRRVVHTATWAVQIPDTWHETPGDECVTLQARTFVGALQISSFAKGGPVTDDDLRDFAEEHLVAGARAAEVSLGEFTGIRIAFGADGNFWRQWYLRSGNQMIFATYNCSEAYRGQEDSEVNEILASLTSYGGVA